jgi:hypothetical protein
MMNELRILSKIQDLKNELRIVNNSFDAYNDYSHDAHFKEVLILESKINILMEILQSE